MRRTISEETRQEIAGLYSQGASIRKISAATGVCYSSVYMMTQALERINPATGELFQSPTEYKNYLATQRVDPNTGKKFSSSSEYRSHLAAKRAERNRELTDLLNFYLGRLKQSQYWLSEQLGVTRQSVSYYFQGALIPGLEILEKMLCVLKVGKRDSRRIKELARR